MEAPLGGVKNIVDQVALSIWHGVKNKNTKLQIGKWPTHWTDLTLKLTTHLTYIWYKNINILGPSPQTSNSDNKRPWWRYIYTIMWNDPSNVSNIANGYLLESCSHLPWAGRRKRNIGHSKCPPNMCTWSINTIKFISLDACSNVEKGSWNLKMTNFSWWSTTRQESSSFLDIGCFIKWILSFSSKIDVDCKFLDEIHVEQDNEDDCLIKFFSSLFLRSYLANE